MDYPQEFSNQARARIGRARIKSEEDFIAAQKNNAWDDSNGLKNEQALYFRKVFSAFAQEACAIESWSVDRIDRVVRGAVDPIARDIQSECSHRGIKTGWMFDRDNHPSEELWANLKNSTPWAMYQALLLKVADQQLESHERDDISGDPDVLRHRAVKEAIALLEKNPGYPGVLSEIHKEDQTIESRMDTAASERLSEARLEYLLKYIDARGGAYLRLVTDLESEKAFTALMEDFARVTWWQFADFPIEGVPPTSPFSSSLTIQSQRDKLLKRIRHWIMEGYGRLDALGSQQAENPRSSPQESVSSLADRREEAVAHLDITHDQFASATSSDTSAVPSIGKHQNSRQPSARNFREPRMDLLTNPDARLNRKVAAEALGVSERQFDRLVADKVIVPVGPGSKKLFKTKDLRRLLNERKRDKADTTRQE